MNFNWMWGVLSCWLMLCTTFCIANISYVKKSSLSKQATTLHVWHPDEQSPNILYHNWVISEHVKEAMAHKDKDLEQHGFELFIICSLFKHCYNCHICNRPHESDMVLAPPLQCAALCSSPHSMSPRVIQSILHISIHLEHSLCILNAPPFGIHVCKAIAHKDTRLCSLLEGNVHEYALVKYLYSSTCVEQSNESEHVRKHGLFPLPFAKITVVLSHSVQTCCVELVILMLHWKMLQSSECHHSQVCFHPSGL